MKKKVIVFVRPSHLEDSYSCTPGTWPGAGRDQSRALLVGHRCDEYIYGGEGEEGERQNSSCIGMRSVPEE